MQKFTLFVGVGLGVTLGGGWSLWVVGVVGVAESAIQGAGLSV